MRLVLTVDPQHYLYGLGEVPSSWPVSAPSRRQASRRTYAFTKAASSQHRAVCDCALYASSYDQVYAGWDKEGGVDGDRWVAAVNQTDGQVVLNGGTTIQAFYMSSSGGYTENNENVGRDTDRLPARRVRPRRLHLREPERHLDRDLLAGRDHPGSRVEHRHGDRVHQRRSRRLGPDPVGHRRGRERSGLDQRRSAVEARSPGRPAVDQREPARHGSDPGEVRRARLLPGAPDLAPGRGRGRRRQKFQGGTIYHSGTSGAHYVRGPVLARYFDEGGPAGHLGFPTSDVHRLKNGNLRASFETGVITCEPDGSSCQVG